MFGRLVLFDGFFIKFNFCRLEGMGPPSKKRKTKQDNQDKNATTSRVSVPVVGTDNLDNDKHVNDEQQLDKQKTTPIVVRKIQDYPKSAAIKSLVEDIKWKCSYCEFRAVHRSKVIYHVTSNHSERPVRFYRISRGRAADSTDICSRLRGPRSVREANFLRNGNWFWQCPVCNRKHVSKGYLNVHLKVEYIWFCNKIFCFQWWTHEKSHEFKAILFMSELSIFEFRYSIIIIII